MKTGIVSDGYRRAVQGIRVFIREEVAAEYAERLRTATKSEARKLRAEMASEVERRFREKAPPKNGLY